MNSRYFAPLFLAITSITCCALLVNNGQAATAVKQGVGTDLTGATPGVWSGGSGVNGSPTTTDTASWTNGSLGAGLTLGTSAAWGGISVSNALTDIDVSGASALTLGTGGIDLSASAVNLTIFNAIVLGANQTWAVNAGVGLTNYGGVSGAFALTKTGAGTLSLNGAKAYTGTTTVSGGTLNIGSATLASTSVMSIAGGGVVQSAGTLSLNANTSSNPTIGVSGAGTLVLTGTTNSASFPDIDFCANDTANSTANYGCRIATPVSLGSLQRYVWGRTDHNGVDKYGLTGADCQFGGSLSGAGGLTFIAQDAFTTGTGPMETPFCLNAANSFSGPVMIQRGSVYLGAANAFPPGNQLAFNVASGNNGKLFLYGNNATVSDLTSAGAGGIVIANGNRNPSSIGPATLTVVENTAGTYSGTLVDTNVEYANTGGSSSTILNLVVTGPGTLTLAGANTYSGTTMVGNGSLLVNGSIGGGLVTVANNATLGGSGTINGPVTIQNGGTLTAGTNSVIGALTLASKLTLNSGGTNFMRLSKTGGVLTNDVVKTAGLLTYGGTLVVANITSDGTSLAAGDTFYLFNSSGSYSGGLGNAVLPALPAGLGWDVTQLTVNGSIAVINSASPPIFNPLAGSYVGTQTVIISSFTPGATIYYTTDGTTPNASSSSGASPVAVIVPADTNLTIRAYASATGYPDSGVRSAAYTTEATAIWTDLAGGSWSVAGNWTNNIVPNNSGATVDFSQLTLPGNLDVTLDGNWIVGNLIFGDMGNTSTWEIDPGSGGALTLMAANTPTITVKNQTATITAALAGTQGLTTGGTGMLTLSGANTYNGPTTITAGTLQIGDPGVLGGGIYNDLITNNGSLTLNSSVAQTLGGNISGTGALTEVGSGTLSLNGINTYSGGTVLNGGSLAIGNGNALGSGALGVNLAAGGTFLTVANSGAVTLSNDIVLGSAAATYTLIKNVSNPTNGTQLNLNGTISGGSTATELFLNSSIAGDNTTTYLFTGTNTFLASDINLNRGAIVVANPLSLGDPSNLIYLDANNNTNLGDLRFAASMTLTNPIQLQWTANNIGTDTNDVTLAGQISGNNLNKVGTGTLTLSAYNTYSGNTLVSGGTLLVSESGSIPVGAVTVATNATLEDDGNVYTPVTVNAGGSLNGVGMIYGAVTIQNGGTLAAGTNSVVGTLSVYSPLTLNAGGTNFMRITKVGGTAASDLINGWSGPLNYAGTLVVTNITSDATSLASGDTFTLFTGSGGYSGSFARIVLPALPTGFSWDITQLPINGSITVVNTAAIPIFNPPAGGYVGAQTVTLSSLTPGATIYYTTDGSTPTAGSSSGTSPVSVNVPADTNLTLRAYASAAGYSDSGVASAAYVTEAKAVWTAPYGGSWSGSYNWTNNIIPNGNGATADFSTLTLPGNTEVTLDGNWTIGNLTFGDAGNAYSWEIDPGSGGPLTLAASNTPAITVLNQSTTITAVLAGTNGLTTAGAGTLILSGVNSYSGPTTIAAGALQIGDPGVLGGGVYADLITNNGSLTFSSSKAQTLNGNISGTGTLTNAGSGTLTLNGISTYSGGTVLNGGSLAIGNGNALGSGALGVNLAASGTFLTVANNGAVTLSNDIVLGSATATYTLVKNSISSAAGTQLSLNGTISGGSTGTELFLNSSTQGDNTTTYLFTGTNTFLASDINLNRGAIVVGNPLGLGDPSNPIYLDGNVNTILGDLRFATSMTLTNPIQLPQNETIGTDTNNVTLLGQISDGGSGYNLTKLGVGTLTLLADNIYYGVTFVNGGTLEVDGSQAGGVAVATNTTLAGAGTINGSVTVNAGGTLVAGTASGGGTLTLANSLNLGTNSTDVTYSQFKVTAGGNVAAMTLNVNGTNIVRILDPSLTVGTNTLFNYTGGAIGGNSGFGGFHLGILPAGVTARLLDTGSTVQLAVTSVVPVNPNPPVLVNSVSGSTLTLSWPADHMGWSLQYQTNSLSTGLGTNWITIPGSDTITSTNITIDPAEPTVFYRLTYP